MSLLFSCGDTDPDTISNSDIKETTSEVPVIVSKGRQLFEQKCAACHGSNGTAGIGGAANLYISRLDSAAVIKIIDKGKNAMPPFGTQLKKEEIRDLAVYVTRLRE